MLVRGQAPAGLTTDSCVTNSPRDKTDEGNTEHDYRNAPAVGATSTSDYCAESADPVMTSGPVSDGGAQ